MPVKSEILELSRKPELYCKVTYEQHAYQISKQYLYIWQRNGKKKTGKGDDAIFYNAILAFLIDVRKHK